MGTKKPPVDDLPPVKVPADALHSLLLALHSPLGSPHIREMQATRSLDPALCETPNPINVLTQAYNDWLKENKDLLEKKKS